MASRSLENIEVTVAGTLTSLAALSSPTIAEKQDHIRRIDELLQEVVSLIQVSAFPAQGRGCICELEL
jgi:hypothetical protein